MSYRFKIKLFRLGKFVQEIEWPMYAPVSLTEEVELLKKVHESLQQPMVMVIDYDCLQSPFSGAKFYTTPEGLLANEVVDRK